MHQRLALLGATLVLSVPAGVVAAAPASAASYPASVKNGYLKGCKSAAKKGGLSSSKAKRFCETSLTCVESRLSVSDLKEYARAAADGDKTPPHLGVVKSCAKKASRSL